MDPRILSSRILLAIADPDIGQPRMLVAVRLAGNRWIIAEAKIAFARLADRPATSWRTAPGHRRRIDGTHGRGGRGWQCDWARQRRRTHAKHRRQCRRTCRRKNRAGAWQRRKGWPADP